MKNIGKMRDLITLQSPVDGGFGGESAPTYADVETVFGEVLAAKGNEAFEAARQNATRTIRIRLHYRDDVLGTWRVKWMDEFYQIEDVDRQSRHIGELWLTATLRGAA